MAIGYARTQTVKRSAGHSATAAAAYRSGTEITDERTGTTHNYGRRKGVLHTELVTPDGTPAHLKNDRAALWNAAEQHDENRTNSVVAREVVLALPHELTHDERRELVLEHARYLSEKHQVLVDVSIHEPDHGTDEDGHKLNHHAHLLISTRRLERSGFTDLTRELSVRRQNNGKITEVDKRTGKVFEKSGGEVIKTEWRPHWQQIVNRALEKHGEVIDMRSYKDRGLEGVRGQIHEGKAATAEKRKKGPTRLSIINEERGKVIQLALERQKRAEKVPNFSEAQAAVKQARVAGDRKTPDVSAAMAEVRRAREAQARTQERGRERGG